MSESENATTLIFIRRHVDKSLKIEHVTVDNPHALYESLKHQYDRQRDVTLPKYQDAWNTLRFKDFKYVSEYNSKIHHIIHIKAYLRNCGLKVTDAEMIEKILFTFHATLQKQYSIRGYESYLQLMIAFLRAEKYNEFLIKKSRVSPD